MIIENLGKKNTIFDSFDIIILTEQVQYFRFTLCTIKVFLYERNYLHNQNSAHVHRFLINYCLQKRVKKMCTSAPHLYYIYIYIYTHVQITCVNQTHYITFRQLMKQAISSPTSLVLAVACVYRGNDPPAQSTTITFQSECFSSSLLISCGRETKIKRGNKINERFV